MYQRTMPMQQYRQAKRQVEADFLECLAGDPVVGQRCRIRIWNGNRHADLLTSPVTDWYEGYPYAIGSIRIETENSVYVGQKIM